MGYEFDEKKPGETLLQYLERHHCGLNDPLNTAEYTAEEFDAIGDLQNDESDVIITPATKPNKKKHGK